MLWIYLFLISVFIWVCRNHLVKRKDVPILLEPGAVSVHPPAPTLRSQQMKCYRCGGRKREYMNEG